MASLETKIGSIHLPNCVYNASGPRTGTSAALLKIAKSDSGAVLAKSATLDSQPGNPHPRMWHSPICSFNSEGLPNSGINYYISTRTVNEIYGVNDENTTKPYFVSISGKTLEDNLEMLSRIMSEGDKSIQSVEINLACPNVIGKPIIGYDFEQMSNVLLSISKLDCWQQGRKITLGLKLPPYFDTPHYKQAASIINSYKDLISYVSCINTIGNTLAVDTEAEMPFISSNQGFAGLSGKAIKYVALANVKKMREFLVESIDIVGVGGVYTGQDAFDLILCGATAVQVGTCHWVEGTKCFQRISNELRDIMKKKGYKTIQEFKGSIQEWTREGASKSRLAKKKLLDKSISNEFTTTSLSLDAHMIFTATLFVLVAVLLADKFDMVQI